MTYLRQPFAQTITAWFLTAGCVLGAAGICFAQSDQIHKALQLNERAVQKLKAGNLDGAEMDLLAALALSNENEHVRQNLSVVYYEKAVRELRVRQRLEESRRYFKMALQINPDHPSFRKGYAALLFAFAEKKAERGYIREALNLYAEAAEWDPANLMAWVQSANFAWQIQEFEKAKTFFEKAQSIDPNNGNVQILQKRMDGIGHETTLETEASQHFILSADSATLKKLGSHKLLYALETILQKVSYKLSVFPQSKITVVFYSPKDFRSQIKSHSRVAGFYDGKLRIPLWTNEADLKSLQPIIMHELTHVFVDHLSQTPIPKWMDEGLAQWVEEKEMTGHHQKALLSYETAGRVAPLSHLNQALAQSQTVSYVKAFSVTEYLIERFGVWSLVAFIKDYGRGESEQTLFKKIFRTDLRTLESQWRLSLQKRVET